MQHTPIRIKFLNRAKRAGSQNPRFARQLPDGWAEKNGFVFLYDWRERDYDWLAVYDDLPRGKSAEETLEAEPLACPPQNTILITSEPSGIKIYGRSFTRQFGHVVTSQEPFALRHPGRIWSQAGLVWFYGSNRETGALRTASEIARTFPEKTATIATVCSTKRQGHTLHSLRYDFTEYAACAIPQMEVFGHGRRPMPDKAEAIDPFRYHLAIENHIAPHHWTEKLADAFLGLSLPFYFGAPDIADYFPTESLIPIDIRKPDEAVATMCAAIENNEYEKRLPAIVEARRRVIEDYNLFSVIGDVIGKSGPDGYKPATRDIRCQRAARRAHPLSAAGDFMFREALHLKNRAQNMLLPPMPNRFRK